MVTVKVVSKNSGKPIQGKKVSLGFDGLLRGVTRSEYTDQNGEAHFEAKPGDGKVFVNGSTKFHGRLSGRVVVYI
jgi:uncharacterized protein YfaS (alpha-2-macroglobulin family)